MANLLFFTPVLPFPTGHGSAMRAGVALEILAERHKVTVVFPELWPQQEVLRADWLRKYAADYFPLPAQPSPAAVEELAAKLAASEGVYVFRLAAASVAMQVLGRLGGPRRATVLDMDDDESRRAERFRELPQSNGAAAGVKDIERFRIFNKVLLPRFDVKLLAAEGDCERLAAEYPGQKFLHLPNVVRPALAAAGEPDPSRLLFLGTLHYLPNEDGVVYFCESVLPLLRKVAPAFTLRVVGPGPPPRVGAMRALHPEVQVVGAVPEVGPEYRKAGMLVVPLRAGSGTRIKILEAFSYRTPVVSTTLGAEGLGVKDGEHLLMADTPEQFAEACARMMSDGALRARLTENAFVWLQQTHSMDRARGVIHQLFGGPG